MAGSVAWFIIIVLGIIIAVGLMAGAYFLIRKRMKWTQYTVRVLEIDKQGVLIRQTKDSAGVFVDPKTKHKRFYIKKGNVSLNADDIPVVPGTKAVYVIKRGRDYRFLRFSNLLPQNVRLDIGEDDVNWGIETYERQKKMFDRNKLWQYMPYIMMGFVTVIILVIFIYFFKDFTVLKDVAVALKEAAYEIRLASGVV